MTASTTATAIPGYVAGTWTIDPVHSEIGFSVRHMMVSKVRGKFSNFSGQLVTGDDPLKSPATAEIDLKSISTGNDQRDEHIRSADFFEVETYPTMTYRSTGVRFEDGNYAWSKRAKLLAATADQPGAAAAEARATDLAGQIRAAAS
jgi:polyisoprenoid-binding protein YceI